MLCISSEHTEEILNESYSEEDKINCVDVNFDEEPDILIEHQPTGQIRMSSAFIFDKQNSQ